MEGAERILSDSFVRANKDHVCHHCLGDIKKGNLYEKLVAIWEGLWSVKICIECCSAIAYNEDGGGSRCQMYA